MYIFSTSQYDIKQYTSIYVYHCQNSKVWSKQEFQRNRNEVHNATLAL